ncbi:hypothetical protein GEMRC1_009465 [Eukaryota sp. GEM-RC1]
MSCFVCKANVSCIAICCDRFVCSQKCLNDWQKSSCPCNGIHSSLACGNMSDPTHIHCLQSLIVLVSSHLVGSLWKSEVARDRYHRRLTNILPSYFHHVGYVNQRFLESAFLGVKLFLDSNTISTSAFDLSLLLSITSYFKADI